MRSDIKFEKESIIRSTENENREQETLLMTLQTAEDPFMTDSSNRPTETQTDHLEFEEDSMIRTVRGNLIDNEREILKADIKG
jgi:hypothetical protein